MKRFCLILSGCGPKDGSEINEAVYSLLAISKLGAEVDIFAPNREQFHAINHFTDQEEKETRNILHESARIARGDIQDLTKLDSTKYDALVLPGGFGTLKNYSNFPAEQKDWVINEDLSRIVLEFHKQKKTIVAICIVPSMLAIIFKDMGIKLCTGLDTRIKEQLKFTNNEIILSDSNNVIIDKDNKIISTPAFMNDAPLHMVYTGIEKAINEALKLS